jgi:ferric-dicitrate binding protein FerR (iron transport regulator)
MKSTYFNLCVRAITGQISPKQKRKLDEWLEQSPKNLNDFSRLQSVWSEQRQLPSPIRPDVDKAWLKFSASIAHEKRKSAIPILSDLADITMDFFMVKSRPAFAVSGVFLVLIVSLTLWKSGLFFGLYRTITTQNQQHMELTLSDGTSVRLNSGSTLKYPRTFPDTERTITLKGEAYFSVITDLRPFSVITEQARTTVLGTEFNVWARGNETRVIVKEGCVRFRTLESQDGEVEISKGEMSKVVGIRRPDPPAAINVGHTLGWLEGRLVFEKTPLNEILSELERTFDVDIHLRNTELADRTMTADFDDATISEILSSVCLTLGLQYSIESGNYILTR